MDQRRPALGRRPWFALRRRARSLRRAFFAMRGDRVVRVRADGYASPPLAVARSRFRRWRGMRAVPHGDGLVLAGSRAHGRGMADVVRLVGVDATGVVVGMTVLLPGRFERVAGADFLLELPLAAPAPPPGARLVIEPIVAG